MQGKGMLALSLLVAVGCSGQQNETMRHGRVERIQVHGRALEGNLEGDSPDRPVTVYLPPSYHNSTSHRYPVVYLLHGFTDEVDKWWGVKPHFINVPVVADRVFSVGVSEMILVMPDAFTRYQGSMYSNSVTTGN
jgi:S-formylglutathione hydrolase